MDIANSTIRVVAPFVGSLIAALFFSFQVKTVNELSKPTVETQKVEVELLLDKIDDTVIKPDLKAQQQPLEIPVAQPVETEVVQAEKEESSVEQELLIE